MKARAKHRAFIEEVPMPGTTWVRAICARTHQISETDVNFQAHKLVHVVLPHDPIYLAVHYLNDNCPSGDHVL